MCKQNLIFVCLFAIISHSYSAPPSFITKCKSDDAKCIMETTKTIFPLFAVGLPEYNVPSLDPLHIKSINATEGNLLFVLSDVTVVGLKNCEIKKIYRDKVKSKIFITVLCNGKLDGQYKLKGSLLFLPIEGNGAVHADLNSCMINAELDIIEKDGKDGKKHWAVKSWSHNFDLKDKSNVVFENLYDGNEVLGRAARELIANNGNDIIKEIGPNIMKVLVGKGVKAINNFFGAVAIEDLSLEN